MVPPGSPFTVAIASARLPFNRVALPLGPQGAAASVRETTYLGTRLMWPAKGSSVDAGQYCAHSW